MFHVARTQTFQEIQRARYVAHRWQFKFLTYSILDIPWRLTQLQLSLDYFKTRPLILNSTILFFLYCRPTLIHWLFNIFFFSLILTGLVDYININIHSKEAKQFHNADENKITAIKGYRATPEVGEGTEIMAVHPGTQERLFVPSRYAVTSCRFTGGPKRHWNLNLQQYDVAEMLKGDLQLRSVSSQGSD